MIKTRINIQLKNLQESVETNPTPQMKEETRMVRDQRSVNVRVAAKDQETVIQGVIQITDPANGHVPTQEIGHQLRRYEIKGLFYTQESIILPICSSVTTYENIFI